MMYKNKPIIIIDSGVGGLNIYQDIDAVLPREQLIYLADQQFLPYGEKDLSTLRTRAKHLAEIASTFDPKLIIIGCNTLDALFASYFDTLNHKVIHIITPTIINLFENQVKGEIILLATMQTINSQAYAKGMIYGPNHKNILGIECNGLADAIEQDDNPAKLLKSILTEINLDKSSHLILGCTHYRALTNEIQKLAPHITIIDSTKAASQSAINYLKKHNLTSDKLLKNEIYTTGDPLNFSEQLLKEGIKVNPQSVSTIPQANV